MSAWVVEGFSWLLISTVYWWDHGRGLSVGVVLELYLEARVIEEHWMKLRSFEQTYNNERENSLRIYR